jgi:hypothetical protein
MSNETIIESLDKSVIDTFADMAFIDVLSGNQTNIEVDFDNVISIDILKPFNGILYLLFSNDFKKNVAENIYGDEVLKLSENKLDDCILEILNVLCGNFLLRYLDKNISFKMDFPTFLIDFEKKNYNNIKYIQYNVDDTFFEVGYDF